MHNPGFATFTLIALFAACGDDDDNRPIASGQLCEFTETQCDVEEPSCLQSLLDLAACVRENDSAPLPEVHRVTSDELAEQLRGEAEAMGLGPTPWDALLPKLQLLPVGEGTLDSSIELFSKSVAAFYHQKSKDITIVTDSGLQGDTNKMFVMLHELTHYLQDRASDLQALQERAGDSTDEHISLDALIEGEAVVNSTHALIRVMERAPQTFSWERFFDSLDESAFDEVNHSASPLFAAMQVLPYSVGGRYVAQIWEDYSRSQVDDLFDAWPAAFCDWMTASTDEPTKTLHEPLDCAPPLAPEGFSLYEVDSFGSAGALALLAAATGDADAKLAASLRNDAFAVYVEGAATGATSAARSIGVWRLRFASSAATAQFVDELEPLDLEMQTFGKELAIRVSSEVSITELTGDALEACPKLEQLKPMKPESDLPSAVLRKIFH